MNGARGSGSNSPLARASATSARSVMRRTPSGPRASRCRERVAGSHSVSAGNQSISARIGARPTPRSWYAGSAEGISGATAQPAPAGTSALSSNHSPHRHVVIASLHTY